MDPDILDQIAKHLNAGASNYTVFLRIYEVSLIPALASIDTIRAALGASAELANIEDANSDKVWKTVDQALRDPGDGTHGPSEAVLKSKVFAELMASLEMQIEELAKNSKKIEIFWLKEGHPAYPVFWDFAFLFTGSESSTIFIASSSD